MPHTLRRIACIVATLTAPAVLAGQLTGITTEKKYYLNGESVAIKINGSGICENMQIDYQNGNNPQKIAALSLPHSTSQSYNQINGGPNKTGPVTLSVKPIGDKPQSDPGCGSAQTTIHIVPGGTVTHFHPYDNKGILNHNAVVNLGTDLKVGANGNGRFCYAPRRIVYTYRESPSAAWGPVTTMKTFEPNASWPRMAVFTPQKSGEYRFNWLGTDNDNPPEGDCLFDTQTMNAPLPVVKVLDPSKLQPIGSGFTSPPPSNNPPKNNPGKQDCKQPGKQGVGKDNCPN